MTRRICATPSITLKIRRRQPSRSTACAMVARAVRRELFTAVLNGALFSAGVSIIAFIWFRDPRLAGVIGAAMFLTFIWAGLSGVLVPLTLRRLGADPAVASSVFVLTTVDIVGFCAFLGFASMVLL